MSIHLLWTSADSLIVAFALAFIVPQRHVLPLILMFGACDALGSALGVTMPVAGGLAAILLIACGASLVVRHPIAQRLLNAPAGSMCCHRCWRSTISCHVRLMRRPLPHCRAR